MAADVAARGGGCLMTLVADRFTFNFIGSRGANAQKKDRDTLISVGPMPSRGWLVAGCLVYCE